MVLGTGGKRWTTGGQVAFEGGVAEHEPLHWTVPWFVCPHAFAAEVQAAFWFATQEFATVKVRLDGA